MPQRGIGLQPKVGAPAPTLGHRETNQQPQRGCGQCRARWTEGNSRNRVAVGNYLRMLTQGSSCLATLGFGTKSRWDSRFALSTSTKKRTFVCQTRLLRPELLHGCSFAAVHDSPPNSAFTFVRTV